MGQRREMGPKVGTKSFTVNPAANMALVTEKSEKLNFFTLFKETSFISKDKNRVENFFSQS